MGVERGPLATLLFLFITTNVITQVSSKCEYFTVFPQLERPDVPEEDLSDLTWNERPLLPPPIRDDICMDVYESGTQIIHIEEEIQEPVIVARLNYHVDSPAPFIGSFFGGIAVLLGAEIRRIPELDNGWYLVINNRQDYENSNMRRYTFQVRADGDATVVPFVVISVVNIDDNMPSIAVRDHCLVPELGEPRTTDCVYDVTDADGEISTRFMTFEINSDRGDDIIFGIESALIPGDAYRMNMTLTLNMPLDFEISPLHIFSVTAFDSYPNTDTVAVTVQVQNVEHRPPRWVEIWAVQRFDEKTNQSFNVRAIDGDTGIDKPILYRLNDPNNYTFFDIETLDEGRGGGIFHVTEIDRDALEQEVFELGIVAYKYDNESFSTEFTIVIIVDDVNDNEPEPLCEVYNITILEEMPMTLNFSEEFGFHDIDLGVNAQYNVYLEDVSPPGAAAAFVIAPQQGYQRQTFIMSTVDHALLDFEVPEFQHIELKFIAQEVAEPTHIGVATIHIYLENWNDELPMFNFTLYEVSFDETEGSGFHVETVRAYDRDIGDRVVHTLMGNAVDYLTIDEDTGDIVVSADEAFDYHRQNELFVQIRADDTLMEPFHTTTTQLVIRLNDINNTPPTLRLPRLSPQVEENVETGYLITDEIMATDPDTTADLLFEIDWANSYATKQGRPTPPEKFHDCVHIETIFPDPERRGSAIGKITVREVTIDYEEFEMLYLVVRVTDLNTLLNEKYDELTFTIVIVDMNDNPPVWVEGTLDGPFRVREMADSNVVIGSVLATDIDGPLYNQVRYTIRPRDSTPDDLVKIDFYTGQMTVDRAAAIDADVPRWNLYYLLIASDCCYAEDPADCPPDPVCYETVGEVTIEIIDTNNKLPIPELEQFKAVVEIYENSPSGTEVVRVIASDLDRDDIYHTLNYQINYGVNPRLRDFFEVDPITGQVTVQYTNPIGDVLDRDRGEDQHQIFFTIIDNFLSEGDGNRNVANAEVLVVLLDENDNAPELPPPSDLSWSVSENLEADVRLRPYIYAPDIDEPDTDNSRVGYGILSLTIRDRDIELPELFRMVDINNVTGELETAMPLRSYWGTYDIFIEACDYGVPKMCSNETYELTINPFNFHAPEFVFPIDGTTVRLARERAVVNGPLALVNGEFLDRIAATDEDGLDAGIVDFEIVGEGPAIQYFDVVNDGVNLGTLILTQAFTADRMEFEVGIRATDRGTEPEAFSTVTTLHIIYVPTLGDPYFTQTSETVSIFEYEYGLEERHELVTATDDKNYRCSDDCHDIYYHIVDGNEGSHFAVEPTTNILYVVEALNRTESETHTLTIVATNSAEPPTNIPVSTLTVTVLVREANPRPRFPRPVYYAGISMADSINRELLTLQAHHSEGDAITYTIDLDTMEVDPSLVAVQNTAFSLHPQTGVLTLTIQPTASMHGMFEFQVLATDTAGATDTAEVKVYVVSALNRVTFLFVNTLTEVEDNADFIAATFSTGFNMTCNIDQIVPSSDSNGVALDDLTEVRAHFIQDDVPVEAEVIEQIRSNTALLRSIQSTLSTQLLILRDFVTDATPEPGRDSQLVLLYLLAACCGVLLLLCLVLLVVYCVRTKSLNRRLEALSTTKFGSLDSGLNRVGVVVPGTNKHALEGSNPVWNDKINAPDFDAISNDSGDSDLIGVEDLPQFSLDPMPRNGDVGFGKSLQQPRKSVSNHNNNFGYSNNMDI